MTHAVRDEQVRADDALPAFAAAVAHEIRTPLAAVAGEVDLALCRDRSAAEYREALRRIGEGIADLVEITGDLTLVGAPIEPVETLAQLDAALADVRERYVRHADVVVDAEGAAGAPVPAGGAPRRGRRGAARPRHYAGRRTRPAAPPRRCDGDAPRRAAAARARALDCGGAANRLLAGRVALAFGARGPSRNAASTAHGPPHCRGMRRLARPVVQRRMRLRP